jgi:predicted SAM-dependent methyltransferase
MPKIACVMMQKDEAFLLRPWLAYHGHLFGLENLFVMDNGSTLPEVRAILTEYAGKGVHVDWSHASRQDYLVKGDLIGGQIQALDAAGGYDFLIPLDCDEFIVLRTEREFSCSADAILEHLAKLAGEKRLLRFPYQLANHPVIADVYHRYEFFKVFFAAGTFSPIDHGHHLAEHRPGQEVLDTKLVHLHFHHKAFDLKQAQARQSWVGTADVDDRESMAAYAGPSAHLNRFFLEGKDQYYASFLGMVHFYLPHFRALLRNLGAPLDLPGEALAADHQLRITSQDQAVNDEGNGTVAIVPITRGTAPETSPAPAEFRSTRFNEAHYLKANPDLARDRVDPTVHFCTRGFRENRPLRPSTQAPLKAQERDDAETRAKITAYVAGEGPIQPGPDGKRCLELGAGSVPRPGGWLATDLEAGGQSLALDVSRPFPIEDRSFDYIYSQHMIEHLTLDTGRFMLRECLRILKPGGAIRVVTPSIGFLLGLFSSDRSALEERYIQWSAKTFVPNAPRPMASIVFNNFVRAWGHQFIYDRVTLEMILAEAGFTGIHERALGDSQHARLQGLELSRRLPEGFLALESMILEGTRPLPP